MTFPGLSAFTKLSKISKAVDSSFVTVVPAEIDCVTTNQTQVTNFNTFRDALWLEHSLACPLVYALRTWAHASQVDCLVTTLAIVSPSDS